MEDSAGVGRVTDIEMAVDRVVRIESHPENPGALTLSHLGGDIEKRGWIDRARRKINDIDLSTLLGDKKSADVRGRRTRIKRQREASRDPERFEVGVTNAAR